MTKAEQFFFDRAGSSYDPTRETEEEGKIRNARELAKAEIDARETGISFEWTRDDSYTSREWTIKRRPPTPTWTCTAHGPDGKVIDSLCGVDFGTSNPWSDPYRRVCEAEVAAEALDRIAVSGDDTQ